jgi:hypothetical protein
MTRRIDAAGLPGQQTSSAAAAVQSSSGVGKVIFFHKPWGQPKKTNSQSMYRKNKGALSIQFVLDFLTSNHIE